MFVRRVKTASGATAVQIVSKDRGVRRIVEHVGSAHDAEQLAVLLEVAKTKIQGGQLAFDLDALTPTPVTAPPAVVGSQSRVLWEVLEDAYAVLGFDRVGTDAFRRLVLARVIEPASKVDTIRVLADLGIGSPSLRTIWRTLARSVEEDWRAGFAKAAYAHAAGRAGGTLTMVLYDVTTLYFEVEKEDGLRKVGMSKERRVDPQILVGLLVDPSGFPLEVHAFEGNKAETRTLLPVLTAFRDRHQVTDLVVVADAGMLSAANLDALEDAGFRFIVGSARPGPSFQPAREPVRRRAGHRNHPQHGQGRRRTPAAGGVAVAVQAGEAGQPHAEQADRTRRTHRRRHPADAP